MSLQGLGEEGLCDLSELWVHNTASPGGVCVGVWPREPLPPRPGHRPSEDFVQLSLDPGGSLWYTGTEGPAAVYARCPAAPGGSSGFRCPQAPWQGHDQKPQALWGLQLLPRAHGPGSSSCHGHHAGAFLSAQVVHPHSTGIL